MKRTGTEFIPIPAVTPNVSSNSINSNVNNNGSATNSVICNKLTRIESKVDDDDDDLGKQRHFRFITLCMHIIHIHISTVKVTTNQ